MKYWPMIAGFSIGGVADALGYGWQTWQFWLTAMPLSCWLAWRFA